MKKYYIDKRVTVSGGNNYLKTSNFLNLKTYIDSLVADVAQQTNFYPSGSWQAFVDGDLSLNSAYPAADNLMGHFIKVDSDIIVTELAMCFTSAPGVNGNTIAGIYNVDIATGYPTNLIAQTPTQFINNLGASQSIVFSSPVSLPAGIYFIASNNSGYRINNGRRLNVGYNSGAGSYVGVGLYTSVKNINGMQVNNVTYSSTLPAVFPNGGYYLFSNILPMISLKIA